MTGQKGGPCVILQNGDDMNDDMYGGDMFPSTYHDKLDLLIPFECGLVLLEHFSYLIVVLCVHSDHFILTHLQCICIHVSVV